MININRLELLKKIKDQEVEKKILGLEYQKKQIEVDSLQLEINHLEMQVKLSRSQNKLERTQNEAKLLYLTSAVDMNGDLVTKLIQEKEQSLQEFTLNKNRLEMN